jgi:hypothetical protein
MLPLRYGSSCLFFLSLQGFSFTSSSPSCFLLTYPGCYNAERKEPL